MSIDTPIQPENPANPLDIKRQTIVSLAQGATEVQLDRMYISYSNSSVEEKPKKARGAAKANPHSEYAHVKRLLETAMPPKGISEDVVAETLRNEGVVKANFDGKAARAVMNRSLTAFLRLANGHWILRKNQNM